MDSLSQINTVKDLMELQGKTEEETENKNDYSQGLNTDENQLKIEFDRESEGYSPDDYSAMEEKTERN